QQHHRIRERRHIRRITLPQNLHRLRRKRKRAHKPSDKSQQLNAIRLHICLAPYFRRSAPHLSPNPLSLQGASARVTRLSPHFPPKIPTPSTKRAESIQHHRRGLRLASCHHPKP